MTSTTSKPSSSMPYTHRLATTQDVKAIAPLWKAFAEERESLDPSILIKPNFDFEQYVNRLLNKPLSFCWLLEHNASQKTIVGCLFIYFYDEAPPANLPEEFLIQNQQENPFSPRRVGSVLGMYFQPEHRKPESIQQLAEAAIAHAEEMKVSDIDLLISAEQTGIQAMLQRAGFTKAAVQYTRHYDIPISAELPALHPPHPELPEIELPAASAIPLRDPKTNELVRNSQGEPVFLLPFTNEKGEALKTSSGLPIYPTPVRDPATNDWVFDANGQLAVCPPVTNDLGEVVEHQGIPQFHPPAYEFSSGGIRLKIDEAGYYVFCDVERDKNGKMVRTPDGQLVFKQPLLELRH